MSSKLDHFEHWLGGSVGEVLEEALAIPEPAGTSPRWIELLARFGVSSVPDEDRKRAVASTGQTFGASADEVYRVLTNLVEAGEKRLWDLDDGLDPAESRRWQSLRSLMGRIRNETVNAFRQRVIPKRGMFAQAMSAAGSSQKPNSAKRETFVLRCKNCGAPRISENHFTCEYCGQSLGATRQEVP